MATRILFICHGNICRSPMAEGVVRAVVAAAAAAEKETAADVILDSAGISDWHEGQKPDRRAIAICQSKGIDISAQRSRVVRKEDFKEFDLLLAMDQSNIEALHQLRPKSATATIKLFLDYAEQLTQKEVPDPYYDSQRGFAIVLEMIEAAAAGLVRKI